jgi:hypothetical protein
MKYLLFIFLSLCLLLSGFYAGRLTVVPNYTRSVEELETKDDWNYISQRNQANTAFIPVFRVPATCQIMSSFNGVSKSLTIPPSYDYQVYPESS